MARNYFDRHHTANDTVDKIDPKETDQNVAAWAAVVYVVAEMPGDLGRADHQAMGRGFFDMLDRYLWQASLSSEPPPAVRVPTLSPRPPG